MVELPVYIMTPQKHNDLVYNVLEKMKFMGYKNLFVFPQKDLPAFTNQGMITMKDRNSVHLFSTGSGGLFDSIQ